MGITEEWWDRTLRGGGKELRGGAERRGGERRSDSFLLLQGEEGDFGMDGIDGQQVTS